MSALMEPDNLSVRIGSRTIPDKLSCTLSGRAIGVALIELDNLGRRVGDGFPDRAAGTQ